jgi:hypothetical protein
MVYAIFVRTNRMYLRTCGSYKSANHKKDSARKSQIHKVPHLRNVRKSNKLFKSAHLRICDLRNLFADRPPLVFFYWICTNFSDLQLTFRDPYLFCFICNLDLVAASVVDPDPGSGAF